MAGKRVIGTTRWGQERAKERLRAILQKASESFQTKGYEATTIEDIANELKLTKGSIYYYVNSKEELLYECHKLAMLMVMNRLEQVLRSDASAREKFRQALLAHVHTLIDEMSVATLLLQQEYALSPEHRQDIVALRDHYEASLLALLEAAVATGQVTCDHPRLVLKAIFGALNWIPHWFSRSGSLSKEQVTTIVTNYLMRGL